MLGHVVTRHGMSTDPEKLRIIKEWPIPANATQLKAFLGTARYYTHSVPNVAKIACPLYRVQQKGDNLTWTAVACVQTSARRLVTSSTR